jgi:hypothetical protein
VGASSGQKRISGRGVARLVIGAALAALLGAPAPPPALAATAPPAAATGSGGASAGSGPAAAPEGTVTRTATFLTDARDGRVLVPHGVFLPLGVTPTAADLDGWVQDGLSAVAVPVPLTPAGHFPDPDAGSAGLADPGDPGLARATQIVQLLTARGFRVVLRIVPAGAAQPPAGTLTEAIGRLAAAFRGTGGLIGYEITAQEVRAAGTGAVSDAVAAHDPFHLLWREQASSEPAATVAVNDPAGYLTSWPGSGDAALAAFTAAADSQRIGWLYQAQPSGTQSGVSVVVPDQLATPYPVAVAGSPASFGTDASGTFTLSYQTTLPAGVAAPAGLLTAVSLPAAAFPTGYTATVTGAKVVSRPGSALLCLAAEPGAAAVSLTVARTASGSRPVAPPAAGAAACPALATAAGPAAPSAGAAAASARPAATKANQYDGPLLWALPLLGAAAMALLLGVPFMKLRAMRVGSARRDGGTDSDQLADTRPDDGGELRPRAGDQAAGRDEPAGRHRAGRG